MTEFPAPFTNANVHRLKRALLTALWPAARTRPGDGGHALVNWNENSVSIGLTTGVRQARSKSIGLAHELVHAYYTGKGLQMGPDNPEVLDGVPTVPCAALYEYMCVGLGIWSDEPISENKIRSQWSNVIKNTVLNGSVKIAYGNTALRPCY
ncbi:hypothetical protein GZ77_25915 [Endozoicomonas montiporae]|uniref:Uncharacterized protein n=1 Tax=Endozoicomonas montiporae TaxID=1027273 RepID=A0A081MYQ2_9GAMM|nr:M91 family zinc metallopeptidase [Endozoicomonas montiporae]KEQ11325.1 hypothetical protein GZ77_25915 [Endozoicomonas montiporae]